MEHLTPWQRQVAASIAGSTPDLGPVATAHGIKASTEQFRATGQHRVADNDEPELDLHHPARAMGAELQQLADKIAARGPAARPARPTPTPTYAPAISAYSGCILCGCTDHASGSCYEGGVL